MSNFWKIVLLILLNVIVSASVTYGVLYYWDNYRRPKEQLQLVTVLNDQPEQPAPTASELSADVTATAVSAEGDAVSNTVDAEIPAETVEPTPVIRGASVEISMIRNPGDLSTEALRIVSNSDEVVSMEGWRLEDANGHLLTFPNIQLLRKGVFVEVYSRSGHATPYEIFWNLNEPAWESGETAVLRDVFGQIQATYRVP